ncbi:carbohydrate ABC transporter permease [Paenibacillus contaminans]|uniref:Carbohydrate ABC transporter permease n=1 Tax=Paenibacillus contaminans TaxID=450362 RepID=A0A329MQC0_9BACL|nr:carbohydrate ABC transporter permease [Paenibacillus contaminans]RAV21700.1 carbohydrate ABC transporter permease [Paenibacillus contaminans]
MLIYTALLAIAVLCMIPPIHVLAVSLSAGSAAGAGTVSLLPVKFTLQAYDFVLSKPEFHRSLRVTLERVALGVPISMLLTIMAAYPLSKENKHFRFRTVYVWLLVITILFSGGFIPWYMTVRTVGLLDTIWGLVLPGAVPVFNIILLLNFFRGLPKELEESAFMDGAGYWKTLWHIHVPLSLPALATVTLFTTVGHWNAWFDGLILMNKPEHYPLQSYLQTVVINVDARLLASGDLQMIKEAGNQTVRAAHIILGSLPILLLYPFLQRFFMKGVVLGSVKE